MKFTFIEHVKNITMSKWHFGCGFYSKKPMFYFGYIYYDGPNYAAHLGPFWIEC